MRITGQPLDEHGNKYDACHVIAVVTRTAVLVATRRHCRQIHIVTVKQIAHLPDPEISMSMLSKQETGKRLSPNTLRYSCPQSCTKAEY